MESPLTYLKIYISGYILEYVYIYNHFKHNSNHWATSVTLKFIYGTLNVGLKYLK